MLRQGPFARGPPVSLPVKNSFCWNGSVLIGILPFGLFLIGITIPVVQIIGVLPSGRLPSRRFFFGTIASMAAISFVSATAERSLVAFQSPKLSIGLQHRFLDRVVGSPMFIGFESQRIITWLDLGATQQQHATQMIMNGLNGGGVLFLVHLGNSPLDLLPDH